MASNNHRDVSFRRSFHSDRDLRAVYNLFDAPSREKALPERYSVDGLEAPRNSLDIASMGVFTEYLRSSERRHSENIPIGYELPRSHTVCGRRTDVSPLDLRLRTRIPELKEDLHKPRSSSVVARLMGLDPMPGINNKPPSSSSKLPPSQPETILLSSKVLVGVLDSTSTGACHDGFGYEQHLTPFLHPHPQEDKLQELKKELKERRSSSQPNRLIQKDLTIPSDNGLLLKVLPSSSLSSSSSSSSTPAVAAPENLDLLDTLEFLHVNRQIFMKALQDPPHSVLRHMPSRSHGSPLRQHGSNLSGMSTKTAASCRKQNSQSVSMDSKLSKPLQKNAFEQVHRELAPSKIVVLKPTLEKAFPGLQIKLSAEDRNELESRSKQSNCRGVSSKGRKDPREIAKEILKQVQDDVGRKLSKASEAEKEKKQQQIMSQNRGETTGTSDSDGCYTPPSRRASHRSISRSLPNSPRTLDRFQEIKKPADDNFLLKNCSTTSPVSELKLSYVSSSVLDSSSVNRSKSDRILLPKKTCNSPVSPPPPKSLARSRSVPTGAGTKLFAGEKEGQNQRTSSATAKNTPESSLLGGKISGFRNSLSLSRKKESKNQNGSPIRGEASRPTKIGQGKEGRKLTGSNQQNSVAKSCSDEWVPDTWRRFTDFSSNRNQKFSAGPPVDSSQGRAIGSLTSLNGMEWRTTDTVDNSSESSVEKCDQPSPVSVLRMPYAHGSPSTMNNQHRADSDARQDLSLLQLKFRGKTLTGKESKSQRNGDSDKLTWQILESFTLDELMYNERWASEVSYIRDILVVSGLSKSKSTVVCCFSCDHGLNPRVFHIMEKLYATKQKKGGRPEDAIHRRLLFDLVDEAFLKGLAKPVETNIITCNKNNHSLDYRYLHTGDQMMNLLWSNLSVVISTMPSLSHQIQKGGEIEEKEKEKEEKEEEEEEEEDLASLDISKSPSWIPSETETGDIVLDMEKLMFKDLVEELLFDFGLRYR